MTNAGSASTASPTHSRRPARGSPPVIDGPLRALRRHDVQLIVRGSAVGRLSVGCRSIAGRGASRHTILLTPGLLPRMRGSRLLAVTTAAAHPRLRDR